MINVGVLGTGMIAQLLADQCQLITEIHLVGVYDMLNVENARAYAIKNNIFNVYETYGDMLADPKIDTIYTGIPNSLHYAYAKQALQAKKQVIIEKPFASNLREFDDLIKTAKTNHTKIVEVTRVLTLPNYQIIKNNLDKIGNISLVMICTCQYSRKYNAYLAGQLPNVFSAEFSGGALMDLGVYGVHFIADLFGESDSLVYTAKQLPNTIDVSGVLNLKYPDFVATLVQSKNSFTDYYVIIQGDKGTIKVDDIVSKCKRVSLITKESNQLISIEQKYDNFYYSLIDILSVLKDDKKYQQSTEHSRLVMTMLDKARASANIVFDADKK